MLNRFNIGGQGITESSALSLSLNELRETFKQASDTAISLDLNISSNVCSPVCVLDGRDYPGIRFSRCSPKMENRPLTMDINGNLRFCNHSPIVMGNIYRDNLKSIISSEYAAQWKARPAFCENCEHWTKCYGGCRAASEQLGQSLLTPDPILNVCNKPPFLRTQETFSGSFHIAGE